MPQTQDKISGLLWSGAVDCDASARQMDPCRRVSRAGSGQYFMFSEVNDESCTY